MLDGITSISVLCRRENSDRVQNSNKNGYIWHTTGVGKTLTSFKAAQLVSEIDGIDKVMFVVDRHDLDTQTQSEYEAF